MVSVHGSPFDVAIVGNTSFVSLGNSIGVFSDTSFAPSLIRTVGLPKLVAGEAVSPDGRYLLAATTSGAVVLSVSALESGSADAVIGSLASPSGSGGIEVTISPDGRFAFVSLEGSSEIAVFDLRAALSGGFGSSHFVGFIPVGEAPVGMAVSPDGSHLYATSESAGSSDQGSLTIIDLKRAETYPQRSVLSVVTAGCAAVRVVTSNNGSVVWVTARQSDELLAFSATKLLSDPAHSLIAQVEVGEAPVGVAVVSSKDSIVVANSNRFGVPGATSNLSVVEINAALTGKPSLLGQIAAGGFPRQFALEQDSKTLLVTNYDSAQLEAVDVGRLP